MTVQVTERDESKMSHEGLAAGVRIWDVHQQGQLVGMILVLAGSLPLAVELFAQLIATPQQLFALLAVAGHAVQGILQGQARFAQLHKALKESHAA